uniref:Uncharacterized protein n=1 Tax=Megaselia scalaris TaxID=36166 RepID=T1H419_MEGSC
MSDEQKSQISSALVYAKPKKELELISGMILKAKDGINLIFKKRDDPMNILTSLSLIGSNDCCIEAEKKSCGPLTYMVLN